MSRRGLSDIVTTILVILIAMAAVVIAWNVLLPLLEKSSGLDSQAYTTKLSVAADSVSYDPNTDSFSLNLARDAGDGNIAGFMVGLTDPAGNVKTFRQNFTIAEYEAKKFNFNYSDPTIDDVLFITVTPIFRQNGTDKETFGVPIQQPVKNKTKYTLPAAVQNSQVSCWKMEGTWIDEKNGFNGASNGGATFSSNKKFGSQSAIYSTSTSTYTSVPNNQKLNSDNITLVAWVNPINLNLASQSKVVDKMALGGGFVLRYSQATGNWEFAVKNSGVTNQINISGAPSSNQWEFIAAVFNSTLMTIYLNDQSVSTSPTITAVPSTTQNFNIGPGFNGYIDEVMFFNRSLSATEINDIRRKYKG
ncbi:MAG TPA: LamG domain-containing protein [Candidatus Nanoarchaeia archaeon]|nr:LamG domain-containing protein [Candidatus Nanoarchaeia archaeon]